jgi:hypothetical protein
MWATHFSNIGQEYYIIINSDLFHAFTFGILKPKRNHDQYRMPGNGGNQPSDQAAGILLQSCAYPLPYRSS